MEGGRPPEIMAELEPPALRERQRIEQRIEQRDVAEAETKILEPGAAHRLHGKEHDLDIGALLVALAEALDARLAEFARVGLNAPLRLKAEGRAVIAIPRARIGLRVTFEIKARHRHGQVGAEAEFVAGKVGEDIGAASDLFADLIEEDVRRLDDGGRNLLVARAPEDVEQGRGLGFESLELFRRFSGHGGSLSVAKINRHARPKCRASTNFDLKSKTWMAGTSPAMTSCWCSLQGTTLGFVARQNFANGIDHVGFFDGELRLGLLLQIVVAVLDRGEGGAED